MEALRSTLSILNTGRKIVQAPFVAYSIYSLYDQGIADLLGLRTLRHGTCLRNWVSIQLTGADPESKSPGEQSNNSRVRDLSCKNHFFVSKDVPGDPAAGGDSWSEYLFGLIGTRVYSPRDYARCSTNGWLRNGEEGFSALIFLISLLSPTIKFRFDPDDEKERFEIDKGLAATAQKTAKPISRFHLGISGSLIQAVRHPNIFKRYWDSPAKPLFGALELYAALLLTSRYWSTIERAAGACKLGNIAAKAPEQFVNLWSNTSRWIKWPVAVTTWFTSW